MSSKYGIYLMMPIILMALVNCTLGNQDSQKQTEKELLLSSQPTPLPSSESKHTIHQVAPMPVVESPPIKVAPIQVVEPPPVMMPIPEPNDFPVLLEQANIVVDISEQRLYLYEGEEAIKDKLIKSYPVSTSKYGIGSQSGSNKTPLGRHRIQNKIGDGAPEGMIFKARRNTGIIAEINGKDRSDFVTTRIMWLKGLEPGKNRGWRIDSYKRYIYIHGTAEEDKIGQPASHGCIRMYNSDVIDLFDRVKQGTEVNIIR
jgi:lipoprotein-anchoring transpeptidase ErfK/SrfK